MKKIQAILKGRKFTEKLFGLKEKQIRRALEAMRDNAERQKEDTLIAYEAAVASLGDDDVNYETLLRGIVRYQQTVIDADNTIEVLDGIKADLESEVAEAED